MNLKSIKRFALGAIIIFTSCNNTSKPKSTDTIVIESAKINQNSKIYSTQSIPPATTPTNIQPETKPPTSLIQSFSLTYNEAFEPTASLTLTNPTNKPIAQVIFRYGFANMAGWENTSVSRSLDEEGATYSNETVNLNVGQTSVYTIKIPLPEHRALDTPRISVVKIRYSDGTIDSNVH